jgi:hypothetical protein
MSDLRDIHHAPTDDLRFTFIQLELVQTQKFKIARQSC